MNLTAISYGYAFPAQEFEAEIQSVFKSTLNIRPAGQDFLLTILPASDANLPQGIRVLLPDKFTFEYMRKGEKVSYTDNLLHFEGCTLTMDLNNAVRWVCNLPDLSTTGSNPAVTASWQMTWRLLNERQRQVGADFVASALLINDDPEAGLILRRAGEAVRSLVDSTRQLRLNPDTGAADLIGLGPGLTPSGDDFLVGYLAGLCCLAGNDPERRNFLGELSQAVNRLSSKTNDLSRTFIHHAAQGQVSSHLQDLAFSISNPADRFQLRSAFESAVKVGHTSGMDAVTGLLAGLSVWDGPGRIVHN